MTPDQFTALAELLRLRVGPQAAGAYMVLVDGLRPADAARQAGCSRSGLANTLAACRHGIELANKVAG